LISNKNKSLTVIICACFIVYLTTKLKDHQTMKD